MGPWTGLDRLPEAVVVLDDAGRVLARNDRAQRLLGLGPASVGAPIAEVLELRDDAGVRCELDPSPPLVGDRLAERVLHVHDGDQDRPVAVAGRFSEGELVLTARSAGRREALDAVRGDVVATVSHELRSPLTSVKGFTRTLLGRWERFSDEQKRTMLETIDADADRVTRLLGELLDVSRIDAGRVQLARSVTDVGQLVTAVVDKARHRGIGTGRDLHVEVADDVPKVLADADKIEQVVTNLVENALGYAPESPVRVLAAREDVEGVRVTVADDGPGVPTDQARGIFRKFGRGRDNRRAGTGLGLYITRGLVRAHGGEVWLDPGPGGATFHVTLPAGE